MLSLILYIVAAVLMAVAAFGAPRTVFHFGWLGAAVLALGLASQV